MATTFDSRTRYGRSALVSSASTRCAAMPPPLRSPSKRWPSATSRLPPSSATSVKKCPSPCSSRISSRPGAYAHSGSQMPRGSTRRRRCVVRRPTASCAWTDARERRERADDVTAVAPHVRLAVRAEQRRVEGRERRALQTAVAHEAPDVAVGACDLVVAVLDEAHIDVPIRQLLDERRRETDGDLVAHALIAQVVKQSEEREVRAQDRFVDPLLAMRPAPRATGVRQVRMEHERECLGHYRMMAPKLPPCP